MKLKICPKQLIILFLVLSCQLQAQEDIWTEDFSDESNYDKGYYGVIENMDGITRWNLDVSNCALVDTSLYENYVRVVVGTSYRRMEAQKCNGEAVWRSETINISRYSNVNISILIKEVGTSSNTEKYIKAYYRIDEGIETLLDTNGENVGDWGTANASQQGLSGNELEIIILLNSPTADRVYFDDIIISGEPLPNDTNTIIQIPDIQINPQTIISTTTQKEQAMEVLRFRISDQPEGNDGVPTKVKSIRIDNANPENSALWTQNIAGVVLYANQIEVNYQEIEIYQDSIKISFSEGQFEIPDNENREISLRCYLKNSEIEDNKTLQFIINKNANGFETFSSGSGFETNITTSITSPAHTISVTASQLRFNQLPTEIVRDQNFTIEITSDDENGNKDIDFAQNITISLSTESGNLKFQNEPQPEWNNGSIKWENLQYDAVGNIKIKAETEGMEIAETSEITSRAVRSGFAEITEWTPIDTIISALSVTQNSACKIFQFKITDTNDDKYPTQIKTIQIDAGANNNLNWEDHIQEIIIKENEEKLSVNTNIIDNSLKIEFLDTVQTGIIGNGETREFSLWIYFKKGDLPDNAKLQFRINPLHENWEAIDTGSDFKTQFADTLDGTTFMIDVKATQMKIISEPKKVEIETTFEIEAQAEDIYENIDQDIQTPAYLKLGAGNGTIASMSNLEQFPENGLYRWENITYNESENFTIQIETENLKTTQSSNISATDKTSQLLNTQNQIENTKLNSLASTPETAVETFRFKIRDEATNDKLPTIITTLKIYNTFPENSISWKKHISGATLTEDNTIISKTKNIQNDEIRFSSTNGVLEVPNGEERELTLTIYFKKTQLPDNKAFQCYIPEKNHGWKTHISGSELIDTLQNTLQSPISNLNVEATHLYFTQAPITTDTTNSSFNITITAGDTNRNIDKDAQNAIKLEIKAEKETITEEVETNIIAGECRIYSLKHLENKNVSLKIKTFDEKLHSDSLKIKNHPLKTYFKNNFENQELSTWEYTEDWIASSYKAISENYSLKHNLTQVSGKSCMSHQLKNMKLDAETIIWRFILKNGNWDPSSSNRFCYYLTADKSDLNSVSTAYGIGVNQEGSNDLLSLWKFNSGKSPEKLIETDFDWDEEDAVAIEVKHTITGEWSLKYNRLGNFENMYPTKSVHDEIENDTTEIYTGISFDFGSASKAGLFWVDEIEIFRLNMSPYLKHVIPLSTNALKLVFSESLDKEKSGNINNFELFKEGENIDLKTLKWNEFNNELLLFTADSMETASFHIKILKMIDLDGNASTEQKANFNFFAPPHPFDVVINEIMSDESPAVGLPEYEFLELHNTKYYDIPLNKWQLTVKNKSVMLPDDTIKGNGHLILCSNSAVNKFTVWGDVLGISNFPSLTNSGAEIQLFSASGELIDKVNYSNSWYNNTEKENGGWSLERIDPKNTHGKANNWSASNDAKGGTPGQINSIKDNNPDNEPPFVTLIKIAGENMLELHFNEPLDTLNSCYAEYFNITPSAEQAVSVNVTDTEGKTIILFFDNPFQSNTIYELNMSENIRDYADNKITQTNKNFSVPSIATAGDIVINEILFDPYPQNADFVEIINLSEKIIDLSSLSLANKNQFYELDEIYHLSDKPDMICQGEIVLLTTDTSSVLQQYLNSDPLNFRQIGKMPSFPDNKGRVIILNNSNDIIDELAYEDDMHFGLLSSTEGVSLERINPKRLTSETANWHSAAQSVGFGTPGMQNSVFNKSEVESKEMSINPRLFSPNSDGINDQLNISLQLDKPGYVANIKIYDIYGNEICRIANNQLLGMDENFAWDGLVRGKNQAPIGIYVIYTELFNPKGQVKILKKTCVLGGKL